MLPWSSLLGYCLVPQPSSSRFSRSYLEACQAVQRPRVDELLRVLHRHDEGMKECVRVQQGQAVMAAVKKLEHTLCDKCSMVWASGLCFKNQHHWQCAQGQAVLACCHESISHTACECGLIGEQL